MTSGKPLKFPAICLQPRLSSTNSLETSNAQRQKTQTATNKLSAQWFPAENGQMSSTCSNFLSICATRSWLRANCREFQGLSKAH